MSVDETSKRRNIASNTIIYVTQLTDALYQLQKLSDERAKLVDPFVDSDFTGTANSQANAAMIGTFFDFVLPSLVTNYQDAGNGGRNEQILLQLRS